MEFEWDENKEEINIRKHGVSFSEAREAFYAENAIDDYEEFHSDEEQRFTLMVINKKTSVRIIYSSPQHRYSSNFCEKS